jgi:glycerol-3-phosphate dehydrogenase (NAD(P)+)
MVSKGLVCENGSLGTLPDLFVSALPEPARRHIDGPVTIGGPCIAGELARRVETCVVLGSRSESILERVASMLSCPYYHVWTSTDLVGVAFCAALKNAYAMGMAFASGLHERIGGKHGSVAMHNYEAAVFAESVHEMMRLAVLFGAEPKTVYGLAGVGDLHVTCNGGRTGRFGRLLGLGLSPRAAEQQMEGATLECLEILAAVRAVLPELERAGKLRPGELPLFRHMAAVALDGEPIATPFEAFFGASWF